MLLPLLHGAIDPVGLPEKVSALIAAPIQAALAKPQDTSAQGALNMRNAARGSAGKRLAALNAHVRGHAHEMATARATCLGHIFGRRSQQYLVNTLYINYVSLLRWRREWDSNPRYACAYTGFRDRPIQPLWHLSGRRDFITRLLRFTL